jgi:hypothetical protein
MNENQIRKQVVDTAAYYIGVKEGTASHKAIVDLYNSRTPRARGYALKYTDAWCAGFVSAIAIKLGYTDIIPPEVSCGRMIELFQNIGCWVESDAYVPKAADIIFYDWDDSGSGDNKGGSDHVGIVESVSGSTLTIIEGNYSDAVKRRNISVNGRYIRGYGVPNYAKKATSSAPVVNTPAAKKSVDEIAKEVIDGKWGNGADRKAKLSAAGYDYNAVQTKVNALVSGKKSVDEIAREVIQGKWGNGADRKNRLAAAGYNYAEVQKKVNELL